MFWFPICFVVKQTWRKSHEVSLLRLDFTHTIVLFCLWSTGVISNNSWPLSFRLRHAIPNSEFHQTFNDSLLFGSPYSEDIMRFESRRNKINKYGADPAMIPLDWCIVCEHFLPHLITSSVRKILDKDAKLIIKRSKYYYFWLHMNKTAASDNSWPSKEQWMLLKSLDHTYSYLNC